MTTLHLVALGTRGDVEPVLRLAAELQGRGHRVLVHGAARYAALAADPEVPYRGIADPELFGATPLARRLILAQSGVTYVHLRRVYRRWSRAVWADLNHRAAPADVLLCGLGAAALAQAWHHRGRRAALVLLAEVAPAVHTSAHAGAVVARATRWRDESMWRLSVQMSDAGSPDIGQARRASRASGPRPLPVIYAVSDTLSRGTASTPAHVTRTGHLIEPLTAGVVTAGSEPDSANQPTVYVGLGSITEVSSRVARRLDALAGELGVRLITDSSPAPRHTLRHTVALTGSDHREVFPQVSGVLHHGGAGTTVTGLLAARPTATVPQLGDQFALARRVYQLGAGPPPLHRHRLSTNALRRTLTALIDPDAPHRQAARELSHRLAAENGPARAADACEQIAAGTSDFGSTA